MNYTAYIDGASSGNPGHAGIGIVVYRDKEEVLRESKYIGETTNNVAEYTALTTLLVLAKKYKMKRIKVFTDSELMVKQISGEYKVKNENLKPLYEKVMAYKKDIEFEVNHVGREGNKDADKLAKAGSKRGDIAKKKIGK